MTTRAGTAAAADEITDMRTRGWIAALAAAAALCVPATAHAHQHRAPDALLVTDMGSGAGHNYSTTWSQRQGDL